MELSLQCQFSLSFSARCLSPALRKLHVSGSNLFAIDLPDFTTDDMLECLFKSMPELKVVDCTQCKLLTRIKCESTALVTLLLSKCTSVSVLQLNCPALETLSLDEVGHVSDLVCSK